MKNLKKFFVILAVLALCLALVSCGNEKTPVGDETTGNNIAETNTPVETEEENKEPTLPEGINPDDYYKFVEFKLAEGDPRQAVVEHMRTQANVKWVAANDISYEAWSNLLKYETGKTYYGMPYSDFNSSYHKFVSELEPNTGKFSSDATSWEDITGVGCCSAILNAIQQVTNDVYGETANFVPNGKYTRAIKLGDYEVKENCRQTDEIVAANDEQTMYEAYALLDVGDVIVRRRNGAPHIRLITEKATVVYSASGKVNPGRSYVKCIEQTNAFDTTRTDGKVTTWREDKLYTFSDLIKSTYLPVTLAVYESPETELPYLALKDEITPDILAKKCLVGSVTSNYPLKHVYINVYDNNGKLVKQYVNGGMDDSFSVSLASKAKKLFEDLPAGNYTFVVDAGIALGSAEMCRVEFTLQ